MLSWEKYGGYINPDGEFVDRLTPAQVFEMQDKAAARLAAIEEENKRKAQAEREYTSLVKQRDAELAKQKVQHDKELYQKMSKKAQEQENLSRYGVSFDLGNPKSLEDRMLRANYWRIENGWKTLVNYVNGKSKKYYALSDQFARAKTESERAVIIEQMEKMFPTRKSAVNRVEKNVRLGR